MKTIAILLLFVSLGMCQLVTVPVPVPSVPVPPVLPVPPLPTYVGAGVAFNQIGTPRVNIWAGAIYPLSSPAGVYLSTVSDIVPILQTDPITHREFYAFSTSIRQGVHKLIGTWGKVLVLLGGDAGAGFSQSVPSGVSVSFAGSFTMTGVYQLTPHLAAVLPIRALWIGQSKTWNALPEFGILFKP